MNTTPEEQAMGRAGQPEAGIEEKPVKTRPWARYVAKQIDLLLLYFVPVLIVGFLVGLTGLFVEPLGYWLDDVLYSDYSYFFDLALGVITILTIYPLVEAAIISGIGSTPGKSLMGISLRTTDGSKLGFGQALRRTYGALILGLGMGLPILTLVAHVLSYNRLKENGITRWDAGTQTRYLSRAVNPFRWIVGIAIAVLVVLANVVLAIAARLGSF
ncbi:RDD family protein [Parvularcula flava]|uniref:RDD family protein n=1 Tax=Aquisalinus luteolus TaxID=1566827 RepID=A0A8J3A3K1_9PROT|nr:RDD family protein [Aquisalinus luteolus]NHK28001.1 RDD family protein [Aquisalinus luteolus]GGH97168.1 hypothetical protein GCM10011355_17730 [Aquisalinus luteolus]